MKDPGSIWPEKWYKSSTFC